MFNNFTDFIKFQINWLHMKNHREFCVREREWENENKGQRQREREKERVSTTSDFESAIFHHFPQLLARGIIKLSKSIVYGVNWCITFNNRFSSSTVTFFAQSFRCDVYNCNGKARTARAHTQTPIYMKYIYSEKPKTEIESGGSWFSITVDPFSETDKY